MSGPSGNNFGLHGRHGLHAINMPAREQNPWATTPGTPGAAFEACKTTMNKCYVNANVDEAIKCSNEYNKCMININNDFVKRG